MSFARNFKAGMDIAGDALDTYESAKRQQLLRGILEAKPVETRGFTAEQGDDIRRAAESGQYDIAYDEGKGGYAITPKADPTQTGVIAQQVVTDFMGTRTAGSMNEAQVDSARQRALAGVVMKDDPVRGMAMMRDLKRDARDDERYAAEKARTDRQQRIDQETDADKAMLKDVDAKVGEWFQSRLTSPDGTQRQATVDDHLAASQFRASQLMAAGKTDAAGQIMKDYNAQSLVKIQLESAQRNEALGVASAALASGNLEPVKDFYNRFTPDGAQVTNVTKNGKGEIVIERTTDDGRPLPPTTMKDTGQLLSALNTFKDPMALYNWSQNEFKNNLAIKADARADSAEKRAANADGRAANKDRREQDESDAKTAALLGIAKELDPNASPAKMEAYKRGVIGVPGIGKGDKYNVEMGDVTTALGSPALDRNGNPRMDPNTGKQMINRDPKKEAEFFQWMQENNITDTNKGLAVYLGQKREAPPAIASDKRAIAIRDDKNLTVEQKRQKLKELGYQ